MSLLCVKRKQNAADGRLSGRSDRGMTSVAMRARDLGWKRRLLRVRERAPERGLLRRQERGPLREEERGSLRREDWGQERVPLRLEEPGPEQGPLRRQGRGRVSCRPV